MGQVVSHFSLDFGPPASGTLVGLPSGLVTAGAFTVVFWYKWLSPPGGSQTYFTQGDGGTNSLRLASFGTTAVTFASGTVSVASNASPSVGAWHHLAAAFDGATLSLYLDGAFDNSGTGAPNYANAAARIGCPFGGNTNFPGRLDDFRVYARALTAAEVLRLAAGQDVAGAADYWPFEEGSGTATADLAGSLAGTLSAGVSWSADVPPKLTAPPASLTAAPCGAGVFLQWAAVAGAISYNVYRGLASGGEGATPYAAGVPVTGYTDPAPVPGENYFYAASANLAGGEGPLSAEAECGVSPVAEVVEASV